MKTGAPLIRAFAFVYHADLQQSHMATDTFSILLLPAPVRTVDGRRVGEIRIGGFVERFAVFPFKGTAVAVARRWEGQLRALLDGAPAVGLPTASNMAWILYCVGPEVRVQQILLLPGDGPHLAPDGGVERIPPREIANAQGEAISEWAITLNAIRAFVGPPDRAETPVQRRPERPGTSP